jgi:hypothetical protein
MTKEQENTGFTSQIIINRISKQPILAASLLEELRENPIYSIAQAEQIKRSYGKKGRDLHSFLGSIISDREVYLKIEIDDSIIESAAQDLRRQQLTTTLGPNPHSKTIQSQKELADAQEKSILSNRANELLAIARQIALSQLEFEPQTKQQA